MDPPNIEADDVPSVPDPEDKSQLCRLFNGFWEYLIDDGARRAVEEDLAPIDAYNARWLRVGARFTSAEYEHGHGYDGPMSYTLKDHDSNSPRVLKIYPFGAQAPASILLPENTKKLYIMDYSYLGAGPTELPYCFVQLALERHFKVKIREDLFLWDTWGTALSKWLGLLTEAWTMEDEEERKEHNGDPQEAIPWTFYLCLRKLDWNFEGEEDDEVRDYF